MADVALTLGFGLVVVGIWLIAGPGWACLGAGAILMTAGGLQASRETKQ